MLTFLNVAPAAAPAAAAAAAGALNTPPKIKIRQLAAIEKELSAISAELDAHLKKIMAEGVERTGSLAELKIAKRNLRHKAKREKLSEEELETLEDYVYRLTLYQLTLKGGDLYQNRIELAKAKSNAREQELLAEYWHAKYDKLDAAQKKATGKYQKTS